MASVINKQFNDASNIKYITSDIDEIQLKSSDDKYYPEGKPLRLSNEACGKYFLGNQAWVISCRKNEDENCILNFVFVFCDLGFGPRVWVGNLRDGYSTKIPESIWVDFQKGMGLDVKKRETKIVEAIIKKIQEEHPSYYATDTRRKIVDVMQNMKGKAKRKAIAEYENKLMITPKKRLNFYPDICVETDELNSNKNPIIKHYEVELSRVQFENHRTNFKIKILKAYLTGREERYIIDDEHYYDYLELFEEFYFDNDEKYSLDKFRLAKLNEYFEHGDQAFTKI